MTTRNRTRRTSVPVSRKGLSVTALAAVVLVGAAVAVVQQTSSGSSAEAAVPDAPSGFTTVWSEDFTGAAGAGVDTDDWLYDTGTGYSGGAANWGTGEIETMSSSTDNVSTDGEGHLEITPIRDSSGAWTSGRIETQRTDFAAPEGGVLRVEASIQQPDVTTSNGAGYWPAFWMLGADARGTGATNWPSIGEIDILENVNGRTSLWSTFHCGTVSGGPCNETSGIGSGEQTCSTCNTEFHTYAMELDRSTSPEQIRYSLDGTTFFTVTSDQVDATTWSNATHHGFFLILNVAVGGGFPGAFGHSTPDSSTVSGVPMVVDYVSVATKGGTSTSTSTSTATADDEPTSTVPTSTSTSTTGTGSVDAYGTIEAESATDQSGVAVEDTEDTGGGSDIGQIADGDWVEYAGVEFGDTAATQFKARVASGAGSSVSGLVEVRLDSRTSTPVASIAVGSTGGWQSWKTLPMNLDGVTGTHDVYLTFTSGQTQEFVNLNWFTFTH